MKNAYEFAKAQGAPEDVRHYYECNDSHQWEGYSVQGIPGWICVRCGSWYTDLDVEQMDNLAGLR